MSTTADMKYNRQLLVNKVNELDGYLSRLKGHLANLEGYQQQIRTYWRDDLGRKYYDLINEQIKKIKDVQLMLENRIAVFQRTVGDLDAVLEYSEGSIDDVKNILGVFDVIGS